MERIRKGIQTKNNIINMTNLMYNQTDTLLTLDELAKSLKLSRGQITNHFPKKELLLLAILQDYEEKLSQIIETSQPDCETINFSLLSDYYSKTMDLLYEYRFAISYLYVNPLKDEKLNEHIQQTFLKNKNRLHKRVEYLVSSGLLRKEIFENENFEVFNFQHSNLLTTWIINYRLYDSNRSYSTMKPYYLRGLFNCFMQYLTEKGIKEMQPVLIRL